MTVENPNVKNTYRGNGSTTVFPFTFLLNPEDVNNVVVTLTDENGTETSTTDFVLSLSDKNVLYPKSGTQPLPNGWKITIQRQIPYTQTLNLISQGIFYAEDIEAQLDRQEMQIQQLAEIVERTVRVAISSDIDPAELIAKIFQTGVDVAAQLLAAQQSASAAAWAETNAKSSEAAAREMAERMNAVLASAEDEIKKNLSAEYVTKKQAMEIRNIVDGKAPINSPALTGTPTVPTASNGTNTNQIASTAFVAQAVAEAGNSYLPLTGGNTTGDIYVNNKKLLYNTSTVFNDDSYVICRSDNIVVIGGIFTDLNQGNTRRVTYPQPMKGKLIGFNAMIIPSSESGFWGDSSASAMLRAYDSTGCNIEFRSSYASFLKNNSKCLWQAIFKEG